MKISACLIVKNEERNISRCIGSYKKIVDEIILVDTGSSDNTVKIARKLGAKIFYYKWDNNFSNARNYAINKAKGDWILFLDADEYFCDALDINFLNMLKKYKERSDIDAVAFKHVNIDINTGEKCEEQYLIRMFRNKKNIRYRNAIHEYIANNIGETVVDVIKDKNFIIYHTGYSKDILKNKVERNLNLLIKGLKENNHTAMTYFYLSDCYLNLNQYSKCIEYAKKFLSTKQKTFGFDVKPYFNIINSMFSLNKNFDEINDIIDEAICEFPKHPEFYNFKARLYLDNQMYDEALKYYNICLELQNKYDDIEINNMNSQFEAIYFNKGKIFILKNNIESSFDCFIKVLNYNQYNEAAFRFILKIVKKEKPEDIVALINSIYNIKSEKDVEFVVRNLSSYKYGIVLAYYANIWRKDFKIEDSTIMFDFLANKNYDNAFQCFYKCLMEELNDWTELYTVVAAMLSQKIDNYEIILNSINDSYKRILSNYFGLNKKLLMEDVEEYLEVLTEFVLMGECEQIRIYVNLKENFEEDISEKIGDILSDNEFYQLAIEQYLDSMNSKKCMSSVVKLGVIYYNIRNYKQALIYFEQALENGYRNNDIFEYINWISTLINNNEIAFKCSDLIKLYKVNPNELQKENKSTMEICKNKLLVYGKSDLIQVIHKIINKNFEIVAYIDDDNYNCNFFMDKSVIDISEINNFEFDYIINVGNYKNISDYGIDEDKIIDLKKWVADFFDYKFYEKYFKEYNYKEIEGIITGMSCHEVGIDINCLKHKFVNLAMLGEDLYYNYLHARKMIFDVKMENLKYCIIGLTPYSFHYDLSLTENEILKNRTNIYYSFYKEYHDYRNKNIDIELYNDFESKINKIFINSYKQIIMKFFRYEYEKKWHGIRLGKINRKKMSRNDIEFEIRHESNMNYSVVINNNHNILTKYIEMLIDNNIEPIIVICPAINLYKYNFSETIYDQFNNVINSVKSKYDVQILNYFDCNYFTEDDFYDPSHLNIYGAQKFTKVLQKRIEE